MDTHFIDAQFDRAVKIVQGLPKQGPIQTGYEEKLTMYRYVNNHFIMLCIPEDHGPLYASLYKQGAWCLKIAIHDIYQYVTATVGNVKTPRPGIFDMLGRAKWSVGIAFPMD